jgi:hypothetical protein
MWLPLCELVRSQTLWKNLNAQCSKQKLFVSNCVRVPPVKEYGLETIDDALFLSEIVNGMGPKFSNKLYDRMGTVHDATMRAVINRQLKRSRRYSGTRHITGRSISFLRRKLTCAVVHITKKNLYSKQKRLQIIEPEGAAN